MPKDNQFIWIKQSAAARGPWIAGLMLMLGAWLWLYLEGLLSLVSRWDSQDNSYCYLVPVIFAYLLYINRKRLASYVGGVSWPGLIPLFLAGLFLLAGQLAALETLVYVSMWLAVVSGTVLVWGLGSLRVLGFPLLILAFAVPPPPYINQVLSFELKLLSSQLAVPMFGVLDIPVFREGNLLDLGYAQLQVVDACSGLRYFFPIILIGLLLGYLMHKSNWIRALLVVLAVPVAVVTNSLRLVFTGVAARYVSSDILDGPLHEVLGVAVFVLALLLLILCGVLLRRIFPPGHGDPDEDKPQSGQHAGPNKTRIWIWSMVFSLLLVAFSFMPNYLISAKQLPEDLGLSSFPTRIGNWQGKLQELDQGILDSLWADDYVFGVYKNQQTGNSLQLLVSYYSSQGVQHTAHAPTSCLLGSGFSLQGKATLASNPEGDRNFPVQQMLLEKDRQRVLSNFWFDQRGRVITNEYLNKFYLFWDGLTRRRTDGALVRVEMNLEPGQSPAEAQKILDPFLGELRDTLNGYLPQ